MSEPSNEHEPQPPRDDAGPGTGLPAATGPVAAGGPATTPVPGGGPVSESIADQQPEGLGSAEDASG